MPATAPRRSLAAFPLLLACLAVGAPASAGAQPAFDVLHTFDSPPRQPQGELIKGSDGALYGTTISGGNGNVGVVFKVNEDGSGFTKVHDFDYATGSFPYAGLTLGPDGALYGTTPYGGMWGQGVVFRIAEDGSTFTKLRDFEYSQGAYPFGGLLAGSDGALYGTTYGGGAFGWGCVYRITTDGSGYTKLHDFDYATEGTLSQASLVSGSDGALYGTTGMGGALNQGTVFRITEDGSSFTTLHHFDGTNGGSSYQTRLVRGSDALYGTTTYGGAAGVGVIFKISEDGSLFTKLHDFDGGGGSHPYGGLTVGTDGALYGTTYDGGAAGYGVVFRIREDGSTFTLLRDLDYSTTGGWPLTALLKGSDATLFGVSQGGGTAGSGVVFKVKEDGTAFATLFAFGATYGAQPVAGLLKGESGALYGTTASGGAYNSGVLFKVNEDGSGYASVHEFDVTGGGTPYGALIKGADGALYGTTYLGGQFGWGVVFKIREDGTGFTTIHDFDFTNGAQPYGRLFRGSDGLYGTTYGGGNASVGVIFKLGEDGLTFAKLHDFDGPNGANPQSGLVRGSDSALYGMTSQGGTMGGGVVFKINEDGTAFTKLHDFDDTFGAVPRGDLVPGVGDALYGAVGAGFGSIVFRITQEGTFTTLRGFDDARGFFPQSLMRGADGALYGTAAYGGAYGSGTVFKVSEDGSYLARLHSFDGTKGSYPSGTLVEGSDGAFYGTAQFGGPSNGGVVYRLVPEPDSDGDGWVDSSDNCPTVANPSQFDSDFDGIGNACDDDDDNDGTHDETDNCPLIYNPDQANHYGGPAGDACDDTDGDLHLDAYDNCPLVANPDQADNDFDGIGNACDGDDDNDGAPDATDNCPLAFNPDQANHYGGPAGDACEDTDGDAFLDAYDNCPLVPNPSQADSDFDGRGDACDDSRISISDVVINEENSGTVNAGFIVTLSPASSSAVTVQYQTTPGTATAGSDYTAIGPSILTFSPGQTAKAVTVKVRGDVRDEDDETYFVDLSAPVGATLSRARGTGVILDDDPAPSLSVNSPSIVEGSANKNLVFTVTLSAASGKTVTVAYATADGGAIAPIDYIPESGQITFAPGQTSRPVSITIRGDLVHEFDEIFSLNLSGAVNATIANGVGFALIQDDDPEPAAVQATIGDATVVEGASGTVNAVFVVSLFPPATQVVKVDYATAPGTAEAGADFTAKSGTLTFQVGQTAKTISVPVKGDLDQELDETFVVSLSNPQGLTILNGEGLGTIVNDDGPPELSIADKAITEGDAGTKTMTLTVSLSATTYLPVSVSYATAAAGSGTGFATADVDYVAKSGTLTLEPGQKTESLTIAIKGDRLAEGPETFFVSLLSPTNASLGDAQAVATILDNEP